MWGIGRVAVRISQIKHHAMHAAPVRIGLQAAPVLGLRVPAGGATAAVQVSLRDRCHSRAM
ncbi:MAG: hypothetical protein ACK4PH_22265 [Aquincola tertiaricarbonis]